MNAYKFNSITGWLLRNAISKSLGIHHTKIYKEVMDVTSDGRIIMQNGKIYELTLIETKNE